MRTYEDEGVVLRKFPVGERDEVVLLFTREQGKMACMAKGVRSSTSRKAGALQLFHTVSFLPRASRGKFPYLDQVKSGISRAGIGRSVESLTRASAIVKAMAAYC